MATRPAVRPVLGEIRVVDDVPSEFASVWLDAYEHRAGTQFVFVDPAAAGSG